MFDSCLFQNGSSSSRMMMGGAGVLVEGGDGTALD